MTRAPSWCCAAASATHAGDDAVELAEGHLLAVQDYRHQLQALDDAVVLVALAKAAR